MVADLNSLFSAPLVLFLVLLAGALIGISLERAIAGLKSERRKAYWRGRNHQNGGSAKGTKVIPISGDRIAANDQATEQLKVVMRADFTARSLLNRPEATVFKALDATVIARNPGWQVMAQVSLGEFLGSKDKDAYLAINSKRVDFALMDPDCCVRHALEYQGNGHHQGSAAARDAVKKEALRKAGIGYHEIVAGHTTPSELRLLVEKLVPGPPKV
ncbi:MAG: DUF2726 domain-containing protein [Pseudomonadota bacterium]